MSEALAVDWEAARMTEGALRAKPSDRRRVIQVVKKKAAKCGEMPWAELETLATGGGEVEPVVIYGSDIAPSGFAFLREGRSDDGKLRGRTLLYSQGWTKHGNGHQ